MDKEHTICRKSKMKNFFSKRIINTYFGTSNLKRNNTHELNYMLGEAVDSIIEEIEADS